MCRNSSPQMMIPRLFFKLFLFGLFWLGLVLCADQRLSEHVHRCDLERTIVESSRFLILYSVSTSETFLEVLIVGCKLYSISVYDRVLIQQPYKHERGLREGLERKLEQQQSDIRNLLLYSSYELV